MLCLILQKQSGTRERKLRSFSKSIFVMQHLSGTELKIISIFD